MSSAETTGAEPAQAGPAQGQPAPGQSPQPEGVQSGSVQSRSRRCVCPGSYDPFTLGHADIVRRAAALYDEVVVAVLHNPAKRGTFTPEERRDLILQTCGDLGNVRVELFAGRLLADVARELGADAIVKGLRGGTDFAYELPMALMNRHLTGVETVFLPGDPSLEHISSSLVKEVAAHGGDVTGLVSDPVRDALLKRLQER